MIEEYFYIEPSALSLSVEENSQECIIQSFLDEFEDLLNAISKSKCKILIDSFIGQHLINDYDELLIPTDISGVSDPEIIARIKNLRQLFQAIVSPLVSHIANEACSLDTLILTPSENAELLKTQYYLDFFHSIMGECYNNNDKKSSLIITLPTFKEIKGIDILLGCTCPKSTINKDLKCINCSDLVTDKDKAIEDLRNLVSQANIINKEDVEATQAGHNPVIGNTIITKYMEIPYKFRAVLDILIWFGMYKIELRDWESHKGVKGSLHNCTVNNEKNDAAQDIVEGWLIIEDRSCKAVMYFPDNIGNLLIRIMGNKFVYTEMIILKETLY